MLSPTTTSSDIISLIPAAGYAKRVRPLPCSKEIYPVIQPDGSSRAVSSYLMEGMRRAGVRNAYWVIRKGKWDIPEYFREGEAVGLNLSYIVVDATSGVPETVDRAYPFIKKHIILFGFPDILFQPRDTCASLVNAQQVTGADLVLGLFKAVKPEKMDMVDFNGRGAVTDIVIKPERTHLTHTWIMAVWTPRFSDYLHARLAGPGGSNLSGRGPLETSDELYMGDIFRDAIQSGLKASYVIFEEGSYLDIGTPDELAKVNDIEWAKAFNRGG